MDKEIAVFVTVESNKQAEEIAFFLLENRLAACVSIVSNLKSLYWWQGKIEESKELLLLIKSRKRLLEEIIDAVKKHHSYTVPEVIALPIEGGNPDYLKWLGDSLCKERCSKK